MRYCDLKLGDWFEYNEDGFIKTERSAYCFMGMDIGKEIKFDDCTQVDFLSSCNFIATNCTLTLMPMPHSFFLKNGDILAIKDQDGDISYILAISPIEGVVIYNTNSQIDEGGCYYTIPNNIKKEIQQAYCLKCKETNSL